jgi:hypothetical protein
VAVRKADLSPVPVNFFVNLTSLVSSSRYAQPTTYISVQVCVGEGSLACLFSLRLWWVRGCAGRSVLLEERWHIFIYFIHSL